MWTDRTVLALSLARLPSARESLVSYTARLQEIQTKHSHTCQETNCLPEKGWATKQRDAGRGYWDPRGRRLSAGHSSTLIRPLYAASVPTFLNNLLVVAWLPIMSTHTETRHLSTLTNTGLTVLSFRSERLVHLGQRNYLALSSNYIFRQRGVSLSSGCKKMGIIATLLSYLGTIKFSKQCGTQIPVRAKNLKSLKVRVSKDV